MKGGLGNSLEGTLATDLVLDFAPGEDEVSNGLDRTDADLVVDRLSPPLAFPSIPTGAILTSPLGWMMIGLEEGLSRGRSIIGTPATRTYLIINLTGIKHADPFFSSVLQTYCVSK